MTDGEELDRWLDTLANRATDDGMQDAEAAALRAAVLRDTAGEAAPTQEQTDQAWHRLAFRMRQEGLSTSRSSRTRSWIVSAAAAVLVVAAGLNVYRYLQPIDTVQFIDEAPSPVRGGAVVVELTDADPMERARTIAGAVKSLGVSPVINTRSEPLVLSFDVAADRLPAVKEALRQVDVPTGKIQARPVRIEISKSR